jgi:hypothetical protein
LQPRHVPLTNRTRGNIIYSEGVVAMARSNGPQKSGVKRQIQSNGSGEMVEPVEKLGEGNVTPGRPEETASQGGLPWIATGLASWQAQSTRVRGSGWPWGGSSAFSSVRLFFSWRILSPRCPRIRPWVWLIGFSVFFFPSDSAQLSPCRSLVPCPVSLTIEQRAIHSF